MFDEDSLGRICIAFIELDKFQNRPVDCIGPKKMSEEFGNVHDVVGLKAVDNVVLGSKLLVKRVLVFRPKFCQTLTKKSVGFIIRFLMRTALHNHLRAGFLLVRKHFEKFMAHFFERYRRLCDEINFSSHIQRVSVGHVQNIDFLGHGRKTRTRGSFAFT